MVPSFQEVDRRDDEGFRIAQNRPFSFFLRNLSSRKHRALAGGLLKRGSCFGCLSLAALCALVLRGSLFDKDCSCLIVRENGREDLVQPQVVISGTSVSVLPSLLTMTSRTLWYMTPLSA